jgi:hypothetical protein
MSRRKHATGRDAADTVGWCYAAPGAALPETGFWRLPVIGGEGGRYSAFDERLAEVVEQWRPQKLLLEAPLPLPAMNNFRSAAQAFGLRALTYAEAHRSSCAVTEVDVLTVRRAVMGAAANSMSSKRAKVLVPKFCQSQGIRVVNDHAGDAAMLWLWYRGRVG